MEVQTIATENAGFLELRTFAKRLAHTNKVIRDEAFKILNEWVKSRIELSSIEIEENKHHSIEERINLFFSEDEALKFWKALFYCVWMSDKVPVQQDLVAQVSDLIDLFRDTENLVVRLLYNRFISTFFLTMRREWGGIDRLRIEKYYSLLRKMVFKILQHVYYSKFETIAIEDHIKLFYSEILALQPDGIRFHVTFVFLDEFEKLSKNHSDVRNVHLIIYLQPFFKALLNTNSIPLFEKILKSIFLNLYNFENKTLIDFATIKQSLFNIAANGELKILGEEARNDLYEVFEMLDSISPQDQYKNLPKSQRKLAFSVNSPLSIEDIQYSLTVEPEANDISASNVKKRIHFNQKIKSRKIVLGKRINCRFARIKPAGRYKGKLINPPSQKFSRNKLTITRLQRNLFNAKRNSHLNKIKFTGVDKVNKRD